MTSIPRSAPLVISELRAILASLEHARRALGQGDLSETEGLWPRLDKCARRLVELDHDEREDIKPVMLALLDELERTIGAFGAERRHLGDKLKSASRNMAAGVAYRQATGR